MLMAMSGLEHVAEAAGVISTVGWAGKKVLGPTLDRIGLNWAERYEQWRRENTLRICRNAAQKLGTHIDDDGSVSPRVAMRILEDGSLCDASVMAEYFGGILAGSRSSDDQDDRGLSWADLLGRLATQTVQLHYLFYEGLRRRYLGETNRTLGTRKTRERSELFLTAISVFEAMGLSVDEHIWTTKFAFAVSELERNGLIDEYHFMGDEATLAKRLPDHPLPYTGVYLWPSVSGVELFLWAHGHSDAPISAFLNPGYEFPSQEGLRRLEPLSTLTYQRE
jgi:hypothetical protein